jgi:hypothetical protein
MKRQVAIASAGRAASTTLYHTLLSTLAGAGKVFPIWEHASGERLAQAYEQADIDYILIKSETFHFLERLRFRDKTTLILLTRGNHLRQVVSHIVSLRSGRFHNGEKAARAEPFVMRRHEFLTLAHMVLMMERYQEETDFSAFDVVERWLFEDFVADVPGHLRKLGVENPRVSNQIGVGYDATTIVNFDEVLSWAKALETDGFRVGPF